MTDIRTSDRFAERIIELLRDMECWYVSIGTVGSTFQLALGDRIARKQPLSNRAHPQDYAENEGSVNLLVWCSWRLENANSILTSSDDEVAVAMKKMRLLTGQRIADVSIEYPSWDLRIRFDSEAVLKVFCDHVPGQPSYDGNWYVAVPNCIYFAGPGAEWGVETRDSGE